MREIQVEVIDYGNNGKTVVVPDVARSTPNPTRVEIFTLPARFRVHGYGTLIEIEVNAIRDGGRTHFGCTKIVIEPNDSPVITQVQRLPVDTWVELALAVTLRGGVWYPPKYDGPLYDQFMRVVPRSRIRCGTKPEVREFVGGVVLNSATRVVTIPKMVGTQPLPRRSTRTTEVYAVVRDAFYGAKWGEQHAAVRAAVIEHGLPNGISPSNVKNLISEMKRLVAAGNLAKYEPPTTKKQNPPPTTKKGGKK